eukprot:CCRYP_002663-RA/>CCRYP_002663-RA protein AED:0.36 eAED:0.36 QI:0/-1/0/1/-1/1/1/0/364
MGQLPTKENRKGHTQRYNHHRKTILSAFLLTCAIILLWCIRNQNRNGILIDDPLGSMEDHPLHQIEYGVQSTPLVMIQSTLDDQLLQRFLQDHLYSCEQDELNSYPGLDNRVNEPVYVYEGYYHSLPTSETMYSKNPNPFIGTDFEKLAASLFTRAFYDAFRWVNREIFDALQQNLVNASTFKETAEEDVCHVLARWIDQGHHFGDLSIQIHYESGNEHKLVSGEAWHTDAENSLLHLAVTLRGERVLHSRRIRRGSNLRSLGKHEPPSEILERQSPGNVYLSSSTLMRHAPQFFDTNYSSRVIAIHARFLYTSADVEYFRKIRMKDSWERLTNVLANTLAAADLKVPTLAQVETRLLALQRLP